MPLSPYDTPDNNIQYDADSLINISGERARGIKWETMYIKWDEPADRCKAGEGEENGE